MDPFHEYGDEAIFNALMDVELANAMKHGIGRKIYDYFKSSILLFLFPVKISFLVSRISVHLNPYITNKKRRYIFKNLKSSNLNNSCILSNILFSIKTYFLIITSRLFKRQNG